MANKQNKVEIERLSFDVSLNPQTVIDFDEAVQYHTDTCTDEECLKTHGTKLGRDLLIEFLMKNYIRAYRIGRAQRYGMEDGQ